MTESDEKLKEFLRGAMPRVEADAEPEHDLWPQLKARMEQVGNERARAGLPWFDWALLAGVSLAAVASPATLSMLFYCL